MIKYTYAEDVKNLVYRIVNVLNDHFNYIDPYRLFFVRSVGSRSSAVSRIHALPRIWRYVLSMEPVYIIEVVSEKYDRLSESSKTKVMIHELLHIPRSFSGGLRPHGRYVNNRIVDKLYKTYVERTGLTKP